MRQLEEPVAFSWLMTADDPERIIKLYTWPIDEYLE